MRYTVTTIIGFNGAPYYVVTEKETGKGVEGYGCETWARNRAEVLNKSEIDTEHEREWMDMLDRANNARSRRTPDDHENSRLKVKGLKKGGKNDSKSD